MEQKYWNKGWTVKNPTIPPFLLVSLQDFDQAEEHCFWWFSLSCNGWLIYTATVTKTRAPLGVWPRFQIHSRMCAGVMFHVEQLREAPASGWSQTHIYKSLTHCSFAGHEDNGRSGWDALQQDQPLKSVTPETVDSQELIWRQTKRCVHLLCYKWVSTPIMVKEKCPNHVNFNILCYLRHVNSPLNFSVRNSFKMLYHLISLKDILKVVCNFCCFQERLKS